MRQIGLCCNRQVANATGRAENVKGLSRRDACSQQLLPVCLSLTRIAGRQSKGSFFLAADFPEIDNAMIQRQFVYA